MKQKTNEKYIEVKTTLNLTVDELALLFQLPPEDIKALELGLMPLDYSGFKRRLLFINDLTKDLRKRLLTEPIDVAFKTPKPELGNRSMMEVISSSDNEQIELNLKF